MIEGLRSNQGAILNFAARDRSNDTIYHIVARRGRHHPDLAYELMKRFLLWDPDPSNIGKCNLEKDTPLHVAVRENAPMNLISLLVHNGASISALNAENKSPSHIIEEFNDPDKKEKLRKLFHSSGETIEWERSTKTPDFWDTIKEPNNRFAKEASMNAEVTTAEFILGNSSSTCVLESHSVYDYLYANPDSGSKAQTSDPASSSNSEASWKWIHLPANNVSSFLQSHRYASYQSHRLTFLIIAPMDQSNAYHSASSGSF